MRNADKTIQSLPDFIDKIYSDLLSPNIPIWYRGQSSIKWELMPSLYRKYKSKYQKHEIELLRKFKQNAILLLNNMPRESFDWLFIMRHYNIPTRLLDWSESPLVALYFAANENPKKDGAVWALSPLELNKQESRDIFYLPSFEEDLFMKTYSTQSFVADVNTKLLPIAFIAPRNTARMQSQLSVFTIHHWDLRPIEKIGDSNHIWRYKIPKEEKKSILNQLEAIGINEFQLFPELEKLGKILGEIR